MWISRKALAEEREKDRQLLLEVVREVTAAAKLQTEALRAQAEAYQAHLSMFTVAEAPEGHTIRDEDELLAEMERMRAAKFKLHSGEES